jgi:hypothetical protein
MHILEDENERWHPKGNEFGTFRQTLDRLDEQHLECSEREELIRSVVECVGSLGGLDKATGIEKTSLKIRVSVGLLVQ